MHANSHVQNSNHGCIVGICTQQTGSCTRGFPVWGEGGGQKPIVNLQDTVKLAFNNASATILMLALTGIKLLVLHEWLASAVSVGLSGWLSGSRVSSHCWLADLQTAIKHLTTSPAGCAFRNVKVQTLSFSFKSHLLQAWHRQAWPCTVVEASCKPWGLLSTAHSFLLRGQHPSTWFKLARDWCSDDATP